MVGAENTQVILCVGLVEGSGGRQTSWFGHWHWIERHG